MLAVNTRITLTHPGSEPAKSQGPWVVSAQPPLSQPGLRDAAWDPGTVLAGRLWAIQLHSVQIKFF